MSTHLVCPIPDSDANATFHSFTCKNDGLVVHLLLRQLGIGDGQVHADVELRDGDLGPQISECLQVSLDRGWDFTDDQVALDTNAVDRDTVLL